MFHGDVSCVTKCVDIFSWIEPAWVPEAKMILRNKWLQKTLRLKSKHSTPSWTARLCWPVKQGITESQGTVFVPEIILLFFQICSYFYTKLNHSFITLSISLFHIFPTSLPPSSLSLRLIPSSSLLPISIYLLKFKLYSVFYHSPF